MLRKRSFHEGIPVEAEDIQPSGRVKVPYPVRDWPEISGLTLRDAELSGEEVLGAIGLVRARVGNVLLPALRMDTTDAVEIHISGVGGGMEFSPHGESKDTAASFYPNQKARLLSHAHKERASSGLSIKFVVGSNV